MKTLLFAILAIFATPALAQIVPQQVPCGERTAMLGHLAEKYGETAIGIGLSEEGNAVELLISKDGKSWSILLTSPDGKSCLVSSGAHWQRAKQAPTGTPL